MTPEQEQKIFDICKKYLVKKTGINLSHIIQENCGKLTDLPEYLHIKAFIEESGEYLVRHEPGVGYLMTKNPDFKKN